ncbi:AraC family transcriptional regulator [Isoptericola sp. NEAU-Y5]|uniref:AraC family transcriptional regulator n=1 Tax=Isoptericola luteus TaxID=2879484 RepID=A0ABS7ZG71_9MICO|nr:AraC family transcriptional regulator [Isoptericola sp. NEAU-Y5]MCA5892805.1 AraC family transcriptional regulator [Isoptericola sp. NEAU-Y5]
MSAEFDNTSDDGGWTQDAGLLSALSPVMVALMDELSDVMFCAKDASGRYIAVNQVFVRRTNERSRRQVLGRRASDLFVPELAERYEAQDAEVLRTGRPLRNELELIRRVGGTPGWFLTSKLPLHDGAGRVTGLVSVSQDLRSGDADDATMDAMARLVTAVDAHLDATPEVALSVADLARLAGSTPAVLDRRVRKVFGLSPRQLVLRARVDRAAHLLTSTTAPLAQVATVAGFYDQPSFTRTFARLTGETPSSFRRRARAGG